MKISEPKSPSVLWTGKQLEAQRMLAAAARYCLLIGGARSGKTFLMCFAVALRAIKSEGASRHLIARLAFNSCKSTIGLDTFPKMMKLCFPHVPFKLNKQDFYFAFPHNGSEIWLGGLDEKERTEKILGSEYVTVYLNEASQIQSYSTVELIKTRLAQVVPGLKQKFYVDLNPTTTGHWTYKVFIEKRDPNPPYTPFTDPDNYQWMRMNPADNLANLSKEYITDLEHQGARHRRRFLEGEYGSDTENALWTYELIDKYRVTKHPDLQRVVVAVDPSGTKGKEEADRTDKVGIVVFGLGVDGRGYVLEDVTCHAPPAVWGRLVVSAYQRHQADFVVGETNFGGAMVEAVIRSAGNEMRESVPFRQVVASRGKVVRAEPISALYEQGKISHVGRFTELEDEMTQFTTVGYMGDRSPDRADALIWAIAALFPGMTRKVHKTGRNIVIEGVSSYDPRRF